VSSECEVENVDYADENEEETIVLDFHRSAEKALGLIYQRIDCREKARHI
jgi:hypothetical protein